MNDKPDGGYILPTGFPATELVRQLQADPTVGRVEVVPSIGFVEVQVWQAEPVEPTAIVGAAP